MAEQMWPVNTAVTAENEPIRARRVLEPARLRFDGFGRPRRAPMDPSVPVVGPDLVAARALSHRLRRAAAERIAQFAGPPVRLHG
jgi:hypothetical protein